MQIKTLMTKSLIPTSGTWPSSIRPSIAVPNRNENKSIQVMIFACMSENVIAMIRGVNCALASCTTMISDDSTKTRKVSIDAEKLLTIVLALSAGRSVQRKTNRKPFASSQSTAGNAIKRVSRMTTKGQNQNEVFQKLS